METRKRTTKTKTEMKMEMETKMETEMGSETSAAQAMSRVEPPFSPFSWPTELIILQLPYFFFLPL
jgi:hypothetical protein